MNNLRNLAKRFRTWGRAWSPETGRLAVAWSAGYAVLGMYWWSGGQGFPYGADSDPAARLSILGGVMQSAAAPIIAALGVMGTVAALAMARGFGVGWLRHGLTGLGLSIAFALALLIPDYRVFVFVAYTLIVLLGTPLGLDPGVVGEALTPPMINQIACIAGGLLWAAGSVGYWRRTRIAGPRGGRAAEVGNSAAAGRAAAWGRRATYVAVGVPIVYALTRYAWALGVPLGITEDLFQQGQEDGLWLVGAALGTLAVIGAILTLGLAQRWGEVFPRWIPIIGARQVPLPLVIAPASIAAVLVTNAGLMFWRTTLAGGFVLGDMRITLEENWAALAPELLWPLWGAALGLATLAYYLRRRGPAGDPASAEREVRFEGSARMRGSFAVHVVSHPNHED